MSAVDGSGWKDELMGNFQLEVVLYCLDLDHCRLIGYLFELIEYNISVFCSGTNIVVVVVVVVVVV